MRLADAGQRFAAFMIDLMIMGGAVLVMILALVFLFLLLSGLGQIGLEFVLILGLIGWFLIRSFYFILLEMGPRAATFGKRACGLRVVARSGERLTADRVIVRNLTREIEFFLPLSFLLEGGAEGASAGWTMAGLVWTGIFAFFPLFNKDRMRVGDLLAGTWVIAAPKKQLSVDLFRYEATSPTGAPAAAPPPGRFTEAQLDVYGAYELQTLERVLREGHFEKIATVAEAIRVKLDLPYDGEEDYIFLRAYYDAARTRMERALLFGKRRVDKHDR